MQRWEELYNKPFGKNEISPDSKITNNHVLILSGIKKFNKCVDVKQCQECGNLFEASSPDYGCFCSHCDC